MLVMASCLHSHRSICHYKWYTALLLLVGNSILTTLKSTRFTSCKYIGHIYSIETVVMQILHSKTTQIWQNDRKAIKATNFSRVESRKSASKKERTVHSHFMSCFLASLVIVSIMASRGGLSANYRERLLIARLRATAAWHPCARNF